MKYREFCVAFYVMIYAHFVVCMRKIVDEDCNVCFLCFICMKLVPYLWFVVFDIQPNEMSA